MRDDRGFSGKSKPAAFYRYSPDRKGVNAVGFDGLIDFIHSSAPQNRYIEEAVREEVKMFPLQAELVANALAHQDFSMQGASIRIEMYDDRLEISNLGLPPIKLERFIDEDMARNEKLSELMRRFCHIGLKVLQRKTR